MSPVRTLGGLNRANSGSHLARQVGRDVGQLMNDAGMNDGLLQHLLFGSPAYLEIAVQAYIAAAELLCHESLPQGIFNLHGNP